MENEEIKETLPEALQNAVDEVYPVLNDEQKLKILKLWDATPDRPPSLKQAVTEAWSAEEDTRSKKGRLVREFLVEKRLTFSKAFQYFKKEAIELTEEQKEFISNNCPTMNCLEMAKVLFKNDKLSGLHQETIAVQEYVKTLDVKVTLDNLDDIPNADEREYVPPKTLGQAAARVNRYILNCIKPEEVKTNSQLQKNLTFLVRFCHLNRFKKMIDSYTNRSDKSLFEDTYVRYVWDKPDLTEEELDLYINVCSGIVDNIAMKSELQDLQALRQAQTDDTEGRKMSMGIVESIEGVRKALDDNEKRQKTLVEALQGKRDDRIDMRNKTDSSLVQLIDYVKNYDQRQQLILLAKKRQGEVKEEIKRLTSLSDMQVQIFGIHPDEIV